MSDTEPIVPLRPRWSGAAAEPNRARSNERPQQVTFDRRELTTILDVYGLKVAEGEWRDYAINFGHEQAEFCVYRRTSEVPLYRVVKQPKLARRQGKYSIVAHGGIILKRGHDLKQVLKTLQKKPKLISIY